MEYLNYYHNKIRNNQAVKIVFSGDSTTYGTSIVDEKYKLNTLAKSFLESNGVLNVTTINAGHESMNSGTWISTYLDQDLAQNPDLYVIGWGFNWYGTLDTRLDIYLNDLRAGLARIRASKTPNQMSIILRTPNSGDDDVNHRNAEWFDQIHPYLIQIARDYQCCFVDFYNYMRDSHNITWQDEYPYNGIPTHVHPLETANANFISLLSEPLIPTAVRKGNVLNQLSTTGLKATTDKPSSYPYGVSIFRTTGAFPYDGFIYNILSADGIAFQINSSYRGAVNGYAIRRGMRNIGVAGSIGDDAWGEWILQGVSEAPKPITLQNSWVSYGGVNGATYVKDTSGFVHLGGTVKSGTTTGGTIIGTLPQGYRMAGSGFFQTLTGSGGGLLLIDSSGNIKIQVIGSNDWLILENISFRAEQ